MVGLPVQHQAAGLALGEATRGRGAVLSSRVVLGLGEKAMRRRQREGDSLGSRELATNVGSRK
jgi:hypothetical protein